MPAPSEGTKISNIFANMLSMSTNSTRPHWLSNSSEVASRIAMAEWLFFSPNLPDKEVERHAQKLKSLTKAPDHWTRLLSLTSLMLIGWGTPEMCAERNSLLDQATLSPASFTFPKEVREVTDTEMFQEEFPEIIRQIFLHAPGQPWLLPEWFSAEHPDSRFFLSRPREFYALAAEVLDPEGETELAQWKTK
jgi:hypothetical protein